MFAGVFWLLARSFVLWSFFRFRLYACFFFTWRRRCMSRLVGAYFAASLNLLDMLKPYDHIRAGEIEYACLPPSLASV